LRKKVEFPLQNNIIFHPLVKVDGTRYLIRGLGYVLSRHGKSPRRGLYSRQGITRDIHERNYLIYLGLQAVTT
jgi:hypothetical protein